MELKDMIIELASMQGPSGFEESVAARISDILKGYMDEVHTDVMGNVIALRKSGVPGAKKLLLDAHMDEIGLIVTKIDKGGFIRFSTLGGVDPRMLPDREVAILTDPVRFGVVACMPPHVLSGEDMDKATPIKEMVIDTGLTQEQAQELIPLGTPIVFRCGAEMLGDDKICGKSLDDRACVGIILRAVDMLKDEQLPVDLYVMASTQEEVGCRGAKTGVFAVDPDFCVAIDVTHGDTPDAPKEKTMKFGGGAAIGVGPNMNKNITNRLISLAKAKDIPFQIEVMGGNTGTNGWVMQVSREGVSTSVLSLPLRYMHTPVETVKLSDAESVARLLCELVRSMKEAM